MTKTVCKLCLKRRELAYSHIIPEFMYAGVYDEIHRSLIVESDPETPEKIAQKGIREYLLCSECEGRISKLETYSAPIITSLLNLKAKRTEKYYYVPNVDYKKFKLFQLSILWRASISSINMFSNISLGIDEERIRKMILNNDPKTPVDYGCFMLIIEKTKYLDKLIWSPVTDDIEGYKTYRFQTGRLFWYYFLPNRVPTVASLFLIDNKNLLIVPKAPWSEDAIISRISTNIIERERKKKK